MDASRRSAHGNAYFIGFGNTKRVVLFDTLLAGSTPEEIEAVVAHELGHYRHGHVLFGTAARRRDDLRRAGRVRLAVPQAWLLPSFGIAYRDDALALLVVPAARIRWSARCWRRWQLDSRRNEFQADDYARRHVAAAPMISALLKLSRDNASTLTPDPLYALVHYSHPPVPIRIRHLRELEALEAAVPQAIAAD